MSASGQQAPRFSKPARPQFSKPAPEPTPELELWRAPEPEEDTYVPSVQDYDYDPDRKPRWRKIAKVATMGTAAAVVVALGAGALWANDLRSTFDEDRNVVQMSSHNGNAQPNMEGLVSPSDRAQQVSGETPPTTSETPAPDPVRVEGGMNVLLMGSDMRPEENPNESRTDTIMVAHISEEWDSVQLVSLPRDLWVQIPGHGEGRINSTFQYGGPPKAVETVESLLNIQIDHMAMIDFTGFADLTTDLGGITIDNPTEFTTFYDDIHYPAGEITLEGEEALHYVRERKSLPHSDLSRVQNQQRVVKASVSELISAGTLTSPGKINKILDTVLKYVSVDEDLTAAQLLEYAVSARNLRPENITSFTAPVGDGFTTSGGAQVLDVDEQGLKELRAAFASGTVDEYAAEHPVG